MELALIAAMSTNRVIGVNNRLPWHLPQDFQRVKQLTTGNAIVMGRKTYDSIGKPLPNRLNIVLSRNPDFRAAGITVCQNLEQALATAATAETCFIFGGASLYADTIDRVTKMYLTIVDADIEGDVFFPEWDESQWDCQQQTLHEHDGLRFTFYDYVRR